VAAQRQACAGIERQAAELSMLALRKLFPVLLQRAEGQELEAVFSEVFDQAIEEPRIVVRAAPGMIEALEEKLQALAARSGFEGKLSLIGDPRLAETDCRVEWSEGGVERDPQRSLKAIEAAVAKGIAAFDRLNPAPDDAGTRPVEETV
jgi:flagellar assembly protein FliH